MWAGLILQKPQLTKTSQIFAIPCFLFQNKRVSWIFLSTVARRVLFNLFFSVWISIRDFLETLSSLRQYSRKGRQQTNYLFNFLTGDTSYLESISLLTHSAPIDVDREISTLLNPPEPVWNSIFAFWAVYFEQYNLWQFSCWAGGYVFKCHPQ